MFVTESPAPELVENVKMLYVDRENVRIFVPIIAGVTKVRRTGLLWDCFAANGLVLIIVD